MKCCALIIDIFATHLGVLFIIFNTKQSKIYEIMFILHKPAEEFTWCLSVIKDLFEKMYKKVSHISKRCSPVALTLSMSECTDYKNSFSL